MTSLKFRKSRKKQCEAFTADSLTNSAEDSTTSGCVSLKQLRTFMQTSACIDPTGMLCTRVRHLLRDISTVCRDVATRSTGSTLCGIDVLLPVYTWNSEFYGKEGCPTIMYRIVVNHATWINSVTPGRRLISPFLCSILKLISFFPLRISRR